MSKRDSACLKPYVPPTKKTPITAAPAHAAGRVVIVTETPLWLVAVNYEPKLSQYAYIGVRFNSPLGADGWVRCDQYQGDASAVLAYIKEACEHHGWRKDYTVRLAVAKPHFAEEGVASMCIHPTVLENTPINNIVAFAHEIVPKLVVQNHIPTLRALALGRLLSTPRESVLQMVHYMTQDDPNTMMDEYATPAAPKKKNAALAGTYVCDSASPSVAEAREYVEEDHGYTEAW